MQIDLSKVQWDAQPAAPAIDINAVQWDSPSPSRDNIPGPRRGGFLQGLGRSAASLADVTIGGVIPAVAQQVVYPFARLGRTEQEAQAITKRVVGAVDSPFGKAFGVTDTPEYQQEAGRQILDFIGQNAQKGAKWISEKTGLPQADVENMMGSVSIAAPKVLAPVARTVKDVAAPAVQQAIVGAKMPFEKQIQARRERLSAEDYARGPQIDAATDAQRLGIAINPVDINPTSFGARVSSGIAGPRGEAAIERANLPKVNEIARREMGLPEGVSLAGPKAFDEARAAVAEPYRKIEKIPVIQADDMTRKALNDLRPDESLIGGEATAKSINKLIDSALEKVDGGLSGKAFLDNVSNLRKAAKRIYNNNNASPKQISVADANMAIANTLEGMIESSIFDPRLVQDFRNARQRMAQIYGYESATDFNTGMVNPEKLARITAKDNVLTGDIAALGRIAGNFPSAFKMTGETPWYSPPRLTRTGIGGAGGALVGSTFFGVPGAVMGTALGATLGDIGGGMMAKRIASPEYQSGLSIRDMRIPINQLAVSMQPIPQNRAVVPYQAPVEVLGPNEGPYRPNFVFGQSQPQPRVTPVMPETNRMLGAPSPESTINALRAEDARRANVSRTLGQEAESRAAAAEASTRRPTSGEVILDFDPVTGRLREASQGIKGATPETFQNFGASLASAAEKLAGQPTAGRTTRINPRGAEVTSAGGKLTPRAFAMTAEEKIAWNKTKVDLAEVAPGFKALSDKAIAEKMMDRAWVEQTAVKAREKAAAFEQLAARAKDERARQTAMANRERMLDLAEQMEEGLRMARPDVSGKQQGPKTRAAQRNRLISDQEVLNKLLEK